MNRTIRRALPRTTLLGLLLCAGLLRPGSASAAGLVYPESGVRALGRGGAFVAKGDDIAAIGINPAQLAKLRGWTFDLQLNIAHHPITFNCTGLPNCTNLDGTRATSVSNEAFGIGNFGPIIGASTNFGLKKWTFAVALAAPPGVGLKRYPETGPQRYDLIDIDFVVLSPSFAAAFRPIPQLRIGATFIWNYAHQTTSVAAKFIQSRNPTQYLATGGPTDVITSLDVKQLFAPSGDVGIAFDVTRWLELAASVRLPLYLNMKGEATIETVTPDGNGGLNRTPTRLSDSSVTFKTRIPPIARFGARYKHFLPAVGEDDRPIEKFDIELNFFYEPWQLHRTIDIDFVNAQGQRATLPDFGNVEVPPVQRLEGVQGAWSLRLGGDYHIIPDLFTVRLGGFYESSAIPRALKQVAFISDDQWGLAAGLSLKLRGFEISASYMHIFIPDRFVAPGVANFRRQEIQPGAMIPPPPTEARVVNAGLYTASYNVFGIGVRAILDEVLKKR